jgi:predicted alpha/beta superfamily hydrolase
MMKSENINGKNVSILGQNLSDIVFIQPVSRENLSNDNEIYDFLGKNLKHTYSLVCFGVENWNKELSPWQADAVFGKEKFGEGGSETLGYLTDDLVPRLKNKNIIGEKSKIVLGGYSLAGLFSLWCAYQREDFAAVAAASPSVWFDKWNDYAKNNRIKTNVVALSLGNKEAATRNKKMATVADNIRSIYEMYKKENIKTSLVWNEGGHFKEPDLRMAKTFAEAVNLMDN